MVLQRRKLFLGSSHKKKENIHIDNWTDFLWQNKIGELYIKNDFVYVYRQTFVWVFDYMSAWEKYI